MVTNTSQNLLAYVKARGQVTAKELGDFLVISRQALYKHLAKLLAKGEIVKIGRPPKVFYSQKIHTILPDRGQVLPADAKIINQNYLLITAAGQRLEGLEGFVYWCGKNHLDVAKTAPQYTATQKKYENFKNSGLIDGIPKLKNTFKDVFLDKLFYLDFYSIERFGKTKLGQILLYAKQSQDRQLISELIIEIKPRIEDVIKRFNIRAVGFIPPTVKRQIQVMKELQNGLDLPVAVLNLVKIKTQVAVPQKSLSKLQDRQENASESIVVSDNRVFDNILLIDDAVGSGATLNETAKKIRQQKICSGNLIGLAITGSFKGFDVISEV
jgi:biotin operon repressor